MPGKHSPNHFVYYSIITMNDSISKADDLPRVSDFNLLICLKQSVHGFTDDFQFALNRFLNQKIVLVFIEIALFAKE